jgi:hypothetical protein
MPLPVQIGLPAFASPAFALPAFASPAFASPAFASPAFAPPAFASPAFAPPSSAPAASRLRVEPEALEGTPGLPELEPLETGGLAPGPVNAADESGPAEARSSAT